MSSSGGVPVLEPRNRFQASWSVSSAAFSSTPFCPATPLYQSPTSALRSICCQLSGQLADHPLATLIELSAPLLKPGWFAQLTSLLHPAPIRRASSAFAWQRAAHHSASDMVAP